MLTTDQDWRMKAACQDHDPEMWFPPEGATPLETRRHAVDALRICAPCPVKALCLNDAEEFGVWGGTTEAERRQAARARHTTPAPSLTERRQFLPPGERP